ncbi:MEKHLA domain-containing protein (plasmid) [Rhizobium tropici CIAT 899]|nr:MEKHLA domain-containing protein [Rhizobium tropici CIAT 899]
MIGIASVDAMIAGRKQMTDRPESDVVDLSVDEAFFELLTGSFQRIVGRPLVNPQAGPPWLYNEAPFVVLAHNTDADPRFVYANKAAQNCFEYPWDEFVTLPSRLSAELPNRAERQQLLDAVTRNGFISDYRGLRIAKSGRRFWIEEGIVWQLVDREGNLRGQAATFSKWKDA